MLNTTSTSPTKSDEACESNAQEESSEQKATKKSYAGRRGEKRPLSGSGSDRKVFLPVTENQLKVLKERATDVLNLIEDVLSIDFVQHIEKKHVSNFISARGDMRKFLRCTVTAGQATRQPKKKKPRRAAKENLAASWGRQQEQGWPTANVTAWNPPSTSSTGWPGARPEPFKQPFKQPNRWPSAPENNHQEPYPRRGSYQNSSFSRAVASSFIPNGQIRQSSWGGGRRNAPKRNANSFARDGGARPNARKRKRMSGGVIISICDVCNVEMHGEASVRQHKAGRKHKAMLNARHQASTPGANHGSAPVMHEISLG